MASRWSDEGGSSETVLVRRRGWRRVATIALVAVGVLFVAAIAVLWIARRPIASEVLQRQFEQRDVKATYELERVGLRTQEVRNLVIGDPQRPDLIARYAMIQLRWGITGSVSVYRIVARGVRLRGQVVNGRVVWGDVSKMMPPPSDKPFALPNIVLDIADSSIGIQTPWGPLGFALAGNGNLSGGFRGNLAAISPRIVLGKCQVTALRAFTELKVVARRPQVDGPLLADRFACPVSNMLIDAPRFELDSSFSESFTSFEGKARILTQRVIAGANGLAAMNGNVRFTGTPRAAYGTIQAAAQRSRLGPIYADQTRIEGRYLLGASAGTLSLIASYDARSANLAPAMLAGVTDPLSAANSTPVGPVATAMGNAIKGFARTFDASGSIRMVNFPGGGAARIESAEVRAATGARVKVSGGDGVTYYWPAGRLRMDGLIETAGGGLPTGQVLLRQPRSGAPMSGFARFAPYQVGASRLVLDPVRLQASSSGATNFTTAATLDGPFANGRMQAFRLPLNGSVGPGSTFAVGRGCLVVSWRFFQYSELQLGPTRLPICPVERAIVTQNAGGELRVAARMNNPRLTGRLGNSPLTLAAEAARIVDQRFSLAGVSTRLGKPESPIVLGATTLEGTFGSNAIGGTFSGGRSTIGDIKLLVSNANGRWNFARSRLSVKGGLDLSDRSESPRFYPLQSKDFALTVEGDDLRAGGSLLHPASGTKVTDVTIRHQLSRGDGEALLDVPALTFGEGLQPEEITPATEGVIALVTGTVRGRGRIHWADDGTVTSTGDFSTEAMNFAAPFGPVTGMKGTIHFTDLLGLVSAPGQTMTVASINPGILVENGVVRYQLLPNQLVKVERGEWPFMGGRLILHETILNVGRPSPKRLTFELEGFDAKQFVDSLGFKGLEVTGTFDGVLPMIFDENGGRIVGGRLDSRAPGGEFIYSGTRPGGLAMGAAFDLISDIRFKSMIVRLDGDLAGEFATRVTIDGVGLGQHGGLVAKMVRSAFSKLPITLNLNITGPFRALIQMSKAFSDPTQVIAPVMPFPIDSPALDVQVITSRKEEEQDQTTPAATDQPSTQPQPGVQK